MPSKKLLSHTKYLIRQELKDIRKNGSCCLDIENPFELAGAHAFLVNDVIQRITDVHNNLEPQYIRWILDNKLNNCVQETVMFLAKNKNQELT